VTGGNLLVRPYLVFEDTAGLRGRLASYLLMGWNVANTAGLPDSSIQTFSRITVGSVTYIGLTINIDFTNDSVSPFGVTGNSDGGGASPVIAVPYA